MLYFCVQNSFACNLIFIKLEAYIFVKSYHLQTQECVFYLYVHEIFQKRGMLVVVSSPESDAVNVSEHEAFL
jgi:hypothetical protein